MNRYKNVRWRVNERYPCLIQSCDSEPFFIAETSSYAATGLYLSIYDEETKEAHARLIASAPELISAAQDILDSIRMPLRDLKGAFDNLQAAVDKATKPRKTED